MAIDSVTNGGHKPINLGESRNAQQLGNARTTNTPAKNNVSSDSVSITGTASQLRALEQHLASLPVVDIQRVDSIKREISSGTFVIDPPKVADKMIQIETAINRGLI